MASTTKSIGKYAMECAASIKDAGKGKSAKGLLLFIVPTLMNQLGNKEYFKCPTKEYALAGWSFMLIPGALLGMVILLASDRMAEKITLCGQGKADTGRKQSKVVSSFCKATGLPFGYSILAFLSWLAASLLFTETYACAKLGPAPNTKNATILDMYNAEKDRENAESKIIGLFLLLGTLLIQMGFFFFDKCCLTSLSKITARLKDEKSYDDIEAKAVKEAFDKLLEETGKLNGEKLVDELAEGMDREANYTIKEHLGKGSDKWCEESFKVVSREENYAYEVQPLNSMPPLPRGNVTGPLSKEKLLDLRNKLITKCPGLNKPLHWEKAPSNSEGKGNKLEGTGGKQNSIDDNPEGASESQGLFPMKATNRGGF